MRRLILTLAILVSGFSVARGQPCSATNPKVCGSPGMNAPVMVAPVINDGSAPGGNNGSVTMTFPTSAAMLAFQPTYVGTSMLTAITAGRTTSGDGGGLTYSWVAGSTATVADPFVLQPNAPGASLGRWILQLPTGGLDVRAGGAKCDGVTDDSTVINNLYGNAINAGLSGRQFTAVIPFNVGCYFGPATTVQIRSSMGLKCLGNPFRSTQPGTPLNFNGVILATTKTILDQGVIDGCFISSQGLLSIPTTMEQVVSPVAGLIPSGQPLVGVSAWVAAAQCGVTLNTDDSVIKNSEIVGFWKGVCSVSHQRPWVENVHFDDYYGIDISIVADTGIIHNVEMDPFWSANLGNNAAVVNAVIAGAGSGGTPGAAVLTLHPTSPTQTCVTLPQFDVVIGGGGSISSITDIPDVGNCTVVTGPNPFAVDGGGLTGATLTLTWFKGGQRDGDAIFLHNQVAGFNIEGVSIEGWFNGLHLNNVTLVNVSNFLAEVGRQVNGANGIGDPHGTAVWLDAAVCNTRLANIYASATLGTGVLIDNHAACSGANPGASFTNLLAQSGTNLWPSDCAVHVTAGSFAMISNLSIGGNASGAVCGGSGASNSAPSVAIDANVGQLNINNVVLGAVSGVSGQSAWYGMDSTSSQETYITTAPRIIALNSGASGAALCNDIFYVADTTAPTIAMPPSCPQGQNVFIKDAGNNAAAHNITLKMPTGSTINGGSSGGTLVLSTNGASANVVYNGLNAYTR